MKVVIPLHPLYWSIHTKDESKRGTVFAFIFGVNWLWRCGVTASFGVLFHELKYNGMTSFMDFMRCFCFVQFFLSRVCWVLVFQFKGIGKMKEVCEECISGLTRLQGKPGKVRSATCKCSALFSLSIISHWLLLTLLYPDTPQLWSNQCEDDLDILT